MTAIWSPETKFRIWFEIEAYAASAMAELGIIPKDAAKKIWDKGNAAKFDVVRIDAIEAEVKHDVIAFLTHLAEIVGPEARFVHSGMTSSDVLDTCLNVQLVRAANILIADVDVLLAALKRRAFEYKMTPTIGRSHGIHAEPTTFGLKLAVAHAEFSRAKERLIAARDGVATCAISGAVGTFAQIDPRVEAHVAKAMGLRAEPVSTQIIPRDRHAMYFVTLGVVASRLSSGWPPKSVTSSAPKCWRRKSSSPRVRRARPPCRTSAIRCCRKTSPGSRAWCAPMRCRRWRTSCSGTSATSRIHQRRAHDRAGRDGDA